MYFDDPEVQERYRSLGFVKDGLSMKLRIGDVEVVAVGHPLNGAAIFFTRISRNTMSQFEIFLPVTCPTELIAGMMYANVARICPDQAPQWK
jgi:hypothetical protein